MNKKMGHRRIRKEGKRNKAAILCEFRDGNKISMLKGNTLLGLVLS